MSYLKLNPSVFQVSTDELEYVQNAIGQFGGDNRAGIEGTLHRISAIKSRKGEIIGLTCRIGRAVRGQIDMVRDLLDFGESILFLGRWVGNQNGHIEETFLASDVTLEKQSAIGSWKYIQLYNYFHWASKTTKSNVVCFPLLN